MAHGPVTFSTGPAKVLANIEVGEERRFRGYRFKVLKTQGPVTGHARRINAGVKNLNRDEGDRRASQLLLNKTSAGKDRDGDPVDPDAHRTAPNILSRHCYRHVVPVSEFS